MCEDNPDIEVFYHLMERVRAHSRSVKSRAPWNPSPRLRRKRSNNATRRSTIPEHGPVCGGQRRPEAGL